MKRRADTRPLTSRPPSRASFFVHDAFQAAWHGSIAVVLVLGILWLIYLTWGVIEPVIVAIVLATMLWPWVTRVANLRIGRWGWRAPRILAIALIYLATFLTAGLIVWLVLSALLPAVDQLLIAYFRQTGFLSTYLALFHGNVATGAAQVVGAVDVAAFGIILYVLDATFISLKIFGNMLRLPMFVVFLAILLGSELSGVWGAILALPIAAAIQVIVREAMGRSQV